MYNLPSVTSLVTVKQFGTKFKLETVMNDTTTVMTITIPTYIKLA